jgi:hypothetical protein
MAYPKWLFAVLPLLVLLHLNAWMWTDPKVVLGFPVNLLYHVGLCFLVAGVMLVLVRRAWPLYLDED